MRLGVFGLEPRFFTLDGQHSSFRSISVISTGSPKNVSSFLVRAWWGGMKPCHMIDSSWLFGGRLHHAQSHPSTFCNCEVCMLLRKCISWNIPPFYVFLNISVLFHCSMFWGTKLNIVDKLIISSTMHSLVIGWKELIFLFRNLFLNSERAGCTDSTWLSLISCGDSLFIRALGLLYLTTICSTSEWVTILHNAAEHDKLLSGGHSPFHQSPTATTISSLCSNYLL